MTTNDENKPAGELSLYEHALQEVTGIESGLAALEEKYRGVVFDVTTTDGMEQARAARREIRDPRYKLESIRKEKSAELTRIRTSINNKAEEIAERILKIENPIHEQIKAEEERIEAEREARKRAEADRLADLLYVVAMPDGSRWAVPLMVIATDRAKAYAGEFGDDLERSLSEDTLPLFESDPDDAHDWAANNMNWSDVQAHARIYNPATPMTDEDFQEGWVNGEYQVVNTKESQA